MVNGQPLETVKVRALATAARDMARRAEATFMLGVQELSRGERRAGLLGDEGVLASVLYLGATSNIGWQMLKCTSEATD